MLSWQVSPTPYLSSRASGSLQPGLDCAQRLTCGLATTVVATPRRAGGCRRPVSQRPALPRLALQGMVRWRAYIEQIEVQCELLVQESREWPCLVTADLSMCSAQIGSRSNPRSSRSATHPHPHLPCNALNVPTLQLASLGRVPHSTPKARTQPLVAHDTCSPRQLTTSSRPCTSPTQSAPRAARRLGLYRYEASTGAVGSLAGEGAALRPSSSWPHSVRRAQPSHSRCCRRATRQPCRPHVHGGHAQGT